MAMASSKKVAIIGAGLAGASVMRALVGSSESIHCEVFEKSRGWGGRMSTRRVESPDGTFYFDHGAQYFTVRDGRFGSVVDGLAKNGIVKPFEAQWAIPTESEQKNKSSFADTSRFWVQGGMNRLCKNIAEEIQTKIPDQVQVHFQKKIVSLRPASHSNQLELVYEEKPGSTSGVTQQTKQFDAVVSTMPLPQFLPVSKSIGSMDANLQSGSLFDDSGWVPCLALMLGLKSKPGYRSASDVADAGFIADGDGGEHWFCEQSERFYPAESELSSWVHPLASVTVSE